MTKKIQISYNEDIVSDIQKLQRKLGIRVYTKAKSIEWWLNDFSRKIVEKELKRKL